ncbi:MAG: TauD/TfdA family dioxygenase, partial [Gammaproteobacteria bacterium]|nr:TauD/TfdA family dioxygenase [Gammaproteobacteria bacterium]
MSLQFEPLHPTFVAEAGPIDLATAHDEACLAGIRAGLARYAVLVFRGQRLGGDELAAFAERLDGTLQTTKGSSTIARARLTNPALSDISNVDYENRIAAPDDRRRLYSLGNRLWHTDASFQ